MTLLKYKYLRDCSNFLLVLVKELNVVHKVEEFGSQSAFFYWLHLQTVNIFPIKPFFIRLPQLCKQTNIVSNVYSSYLLNQTSES